MHWTNVTPAFTPLRCRTAPGFTAAFTARQSPDCTDAFRHSRGYWRAGTLFTGLDVCSAHYADPAHPLAGSRRSRSAEPAHDLLRRRPDVRRRSGARIADLWPAALPALRPRR